MQRWAHNTALDLLFRFAETFDCPRQEICDAVGMDLEKAVAIGGLVPSGCIVDAVEWCAERLNMANFGLQFSTKLDLRVTGIPGVLVERASSLTDYYDIIQHHLPLHTGGHSHVFTREPEGASGRLLIHGQGSFPARHFAEGVLAMQTYWFRRFFGGAWSPRGIELAHSQLGSDADYRAAFGAPVLFDAPRNAILFSSQDLLWRAPGSRVRISPRVAAETRSLVLIEAHDQIARVSDMVLALLPGPVDLEAVSRELSISRRSLQRSLQREGTSFSEVVNKARVALAQQYLGQPGVSATEVAARVGFSHVSVLSRALRRELGQLPSDLKRGRPARTVEK